MPKVVLKGFMRVSADELKIVKQRLEEHIRLTRGEPGCLVFSVGQSKTDPNVFDVYEEFADAESFESHQTRTKNSLWGDATKNVERHYEITN